MHVCQNCENSFPNIFTKKEFSRLTIYRTECESFGPSLYSMYVLTTIIPFKGGVGRVLHLAGSHLGICDQVPLLHMMVESLELAANSKFSSQAMVMFSPCFTVEPMDMLATWPFSTVGTMHGARHLGSGWDHFPSAYSLTSVIS